MRDNETADSKQLQTSMSAAVNSSTKKQRSTHLAMLEKVGYLIDAYRYVQTNGTVATCSVDVHYRDFSLCRYFILHQNVFNTSFILYQEVMNSKNFTLLSANIFLFSKNRLKRHCFNCLEHAAYEYINIFLLLWYRTVVILRFFIT